MRRKTPPTPLAARHAPTRGAARALDPARVAPLLPTAASIALALTSLACSTPTLEVIADPATKSVTAPAPAPSPAPSPSASQTPFVEPEPHELDGDIAVVKPVVKPTPVPATTKPRPKSSE